VTTLARRLRERDAGLWPAGNVSPTRLGWLDVPRQMAKEAAELKRWADAVDLPRVVLLGMGGSSLGPEVLRASRDALGQPGREIVVLDTTDPATVAGVDLADAFFVVSSKSGTTLEVETLLARAWELVPDPKRYAAITDPGTPLAATATERGFNRIFLNPPDIGGRYSVLSYFGLVPAALAGLDVDGICELALDADFEEAVELGVDMGRASLAGRDKVTVVTAGAFSSFGLWVEQLIAESTGKQGRGCVPVPTSEAEGGDDRHVVEVGVKDLVDLGAWFYRWEVATAVAGHVLEIDPFDEPNVAESKANTKTVLANLPLPPRHTVAPSELDHWLESEFRPGDYVSIQAYLPYGNDEALGRLRTRIRDRLGGAPVTAGYGPRFLHSTGQLHKGGPNTVLAVQLVNDLAHPEVAIPGHPYDFGTLIDAQALGDFQSLERHERRVLRVGVDDLAVMAAG
jgi:glucose-6-phosphate isomerase/transaldolase/glucose-6-phosphate isomerase